MQDCLTNVKKNAMQKHGALVYIQLCAEIKNHVISVTIKLFDLSKTTVATKSTSEWSTVKIVKWCIIVHIAIIQMVINGFWDNILEMKHTLNNQFYKNPVKLPTLWKQDQILPTHPQLKTSCIQGYPQQIFHFFRQLKCEMH